MAESASAADTRIPFSCDDAHDSEGTGICAAGADGSKHGRAGSELRANDGDAAKAATACPARREETSRQYSAGGENNHLQGEGEGLGGSRSDCRRALSVEGQLDGIREDLRAVLKTVCLLAAAGPAGLPPAPAATASAASGRAAPSHPRVTAEGASGSRPELQAILRPTRFESEEEGSFAAPTDSEETPQPLERQGPLQTVTPAGAGDFQQEAGAPAEEAELSARLGAADSQFEAAFQVTAGMAALLDGTEGLARLDAGLISRAGTPAAHDRANRPPSQISSEAAPSQAVDLPAEDCSESDGCGLLPAAAAAGEGSEGQGGGGGGGQCPGYWDGGLFGLGYGAGDSHGCQAAVAGHHGSDAAVEGYPNAVEGSDPRDSPTTRRSESASPARALVALGIRDADQEGRSSSAGPGQGGTSGGHGPRPDQGSRLGGSRPVTVGIGWVEGSGGRVDGPVPDSEGPG